MTKRSFDQPFLGVCNVGFILFLMTSLQGCQTVTNQKKQAGSKGEARQAILSITAATSGRPLSAEDIHQLEKQIKKDPQARTAVENITGALSGKQVNIKYCPVDGKRYAANLKVCPEHNVELKFIEE